MSDFDKIRSIVLANMRESDWGDFLIGNRFYSPNYGEETIEKILTEIKEFLECNKSGWINPTDEKPKSSDPLDTYRVWIAYHWEIGDKKSETLGGIGWWNDKAGRWFVEGSPSEPVVTR